MEQQTQKKSIFPLSREFYEDFMFYYPFGNSPAEDFLQSVSLADCREPTVLSLGCGDMRSPMFTIFNNFGLDGEVSGGFSGVHFVLNDRNASILARNILFLYLCMHLPESAMERKKWIASVWAIWYNHQLLPEHNKVLLSALEELRKWSCTWHEWSKCPLGKVVKFSSPATFAAVKKVWLKWQSFYQIKSVEEMEIERNDFQLHHVLKTTPGVKSREEGLQIFAKKEAALLKSDLFLYSAENLAKFRIEYLEYLMKGFVWAEAVLDIPVDNPKTVVNPTMFDHSGGLYTVHYISTPYIGVASGFQCNVSRSLGKKSGLLKYLPVRDASFQSTPLLANCVQQFSMWFQATANMMAKCSNKALASFMFVLDDSIRLCYSLFHYPEDYPELYICYDAIYASNLFDHVSPPALTFSALPLLKPTGTLFTTTFAPSAMSAYLEEKFGFSPDIFPALLGVHCIGHDGQYTSDVNHSPDPNVLPVLMHSTTYIWRNVAFTPLRFDAIGESSHAIVSLLKLCTTTTGSTGTLNIGSVETFLCVLHQFLKQVQPTTSSPQFLAPLCAAIKSEPHLKPHLIQLQTQSLLHGIHMHLIITEDDCPICRGKPLETYIQQCSLSLNIESCNMKPYHPPTFHLQLVSSSGDHAIVKSFSLSWSDSEINLTFFFPKCYLSQTCLLHVDMYQSQFRKSVFCGSLEDIQCSTTHDYVFMKQPLKSAASGHVLPLGQIVKHTGDSDKFETVISMNDACQTEMKASKLEAKCPKPHQLTMCCGSLKSMIVYPYPIDESKIHIKISKKKAKISVTVQRASSQLPNDKTTYFIDTRNKLTHPKFQCSVDVMDKYCNLQALYDGQDHPLLDAKRSFTEFLKHALDGHRVFTFSFPSKRFVGAPDVYAVVYIHDLRFSTIFNSPLLEVSYCFIDTKPQHLVRKFLQLHNQLRPSCDVMVDNAEYKLLKDLFKYFSCTMRHPFPKDLNKVTKQIVDHNLWENFDHAVLFPLYPNPSNPTYQKVLNFTDEMVGLSGYQPANLYKRTMAMGLGNSTTCSLCGVPSTPVKCEQCQTARYCSKECQEMHWNVHRKFCNNPNPEEVARSLVKHLSSPENPETATTDPCAGFTSRSKTQSDAEAQSDDAKEDHSESLCARCRKPGTIVCKCQQVYYCSSACQTLELPVHSKKCSPPSHHRPASRNQSSTSSAKADKIQCEKCSSACARCKNPASLMCRCQQVSYCSKECQTLEWPNHNDTCKKPTGKSLSELHSPAEKPKNPNPEEVARSHVKSLSSPENPEISTTDPCATGSTSRSKTQSDAEAQSDNAKEDHSESLCARCRKPGTIVCKCQQVYYCSSACQTLELPVHSKKCSPPSHHHPAPGNQSSTSSAKADKIQKHSSACARCNKPASLICQYQQVSYCSKECQKLEWPSHSDTCKKPTGKSLSELHSPAEKSNNPNPEEVARSLVKSLSSPENPEISTTDPCATGFTSRSKTQSDAEAQSDDAKEDHSESLCARCRKPGTIVCKCQQVYYCSSACQTLELPVHSEKCSQPSHHHPAPGNQSSTSSAKADKIQSEKRSSACARCKKPASLTCQCQQVSYCSKECQKLEWPSHSDTCKKPTGKSLSELHSPAEKPKVSEASKKAPDSEASKTAPDDKVPKKASLTLDPEKCSNCNETKSSLKKCKCRNSSYCSVECQRLHWQQHKLTCTTVLRK